MKNEFDRLINVTNSNKPKVYYQLNQLVDITGLSIRALKYRMLKVKSKYANVPSLLYKAKSKWQIHYSIIDEFTPMRKSKEFNLYTYEWKNIVTWNTKYSYDALYHIELVNQIKSQLPNSYLYYAVEQDNRGIHHMHFITDCDKNKLEETVKSILKKYLEDEYQLNIAEIQNKYNTVAYLQKAAITNSLI